MANFYDYFKNRTLDATLDDDGVWRVHFEPESTWHSHTHDAYTYQGSFFESEMARRRAEFEREFWLKWRGKK